MCLFIPNGFLIQSLDKTNAGIKNFKYSGINAFHQFPLSSVNDVVCKKLTEEQQIKTCGSGYRFMEFISDKDLFDRYIETCHSLKINIRVLFLESNYSGEVWQDTLPKMNFIGYEYCPVPIDEQIITDLDWCPNFSKFWNRLNEYGLFKTYEDAIRFKREYDDLYCKKIIGDGEINSYLFKVSELE